MTPVSPSILSSDDRRHLFWLAMIHYGEAALMGVFGVICLLMIWLGVWAKAHAQDLNFTPEQVFAAGLLVNLSVGMLLLSWIPAIFVALAGWLISRGKAVWFCRFVADAQAILLFPIGTAVTAYYFKVMTRPNIKATFQKQSEPISKSD